MLRTQYYKVVLRGKKKTAAKKDLSSPVVVLKDVIFDFDKDVLLPGAEPTLVKALEILLKNPSLKFEVGGHTDSEGIGLYNIDLSERRAKAVINWLVAKGMNRNRFTFKGYGEAKPISSNRTPAGRQMNRRVEIREIKDNREEEQATSTDSNQVIDITRHVIDEVSLEDEDGLIQTLTFTIKDSSMWMNVLTLGAGIDFFAGTLESNAHLFSGVIKRIEPTFTATGEINLAITVFSKEWAKTARMKKDIIYPSKNHPKEWGKNSIKGSKILENLLRDAGFKIAQIKISHDKTYTFESPIRQHKITDWNFIQELAKDLRCTCWVEMKNGDNFAYAVDDTTLIKKIGNHTFFWPLRESGEFQITSTSDKQIQFEDASVSLDPDDNDVGTLATKVDPSTGQETVSTTQYNAKKDEWETWVLDEPKLRALSEDARDELFNAYLAGNLGWEEVKPYFRKADLENKSSREAVSQEELDSAVNPYGALMPDGMQSTNVVKSTAPDPTNDASQWKPDYAKLGKLSPQEASNVMGSIARGELKWKGDGSGTDKYFTFVGSPKKEQVNTTNTPAPPVTPVDTKDTKKKQKKRDSGFKITGKFYGNIAIRTKQSYVVEGFSTYSGVYYLYRLIQTWGGNGYMMSGTFVK